MSESTNADPVALYRAEKARSDARHAAERAARAATLTAARAVLDTPVAKRGGATLRRDGTSHRTAFQPKRAA